MYTFICQSPSQSQPSSINDVGDMRGILKGEMSKYMYWSTYIIPLSETLTNDCVGRGENALMMCENE
jgi:hypothetical protein